MRYACDHCELSFEPEDPRRPRCPSCLRTQGIRADDASAAGGEGDAAAARGPSPRYVGVAVGLFVAVVACAALLAWGPVARGPSAGSGPDPAAAAQARGKATRLAEQAREQLAAGDKKAAYRLASEAIRVDPRVAQARETQGDVLLASRAQKEALAEYLAALSLAESGTLLVKVGNLELALGERSAASRHLTRALELEPGAEWAAAVQGALAELTEATQPIVPSPAAPSPTTPPSAPASPLGGP